MKNNSDEWIKKVSISILKANNKRKNAEKEVKKA
jgi:hypothetical protein